MKQEPLVRLLGVTKKISSKVLVDDVTFDIAPGQIFGFLGPNGAGKTTTIRMMVGLMSITQGDITIGGYSIRKNYEQAAAQIGAIVENPEMYKFLSGYNNLKHFARMMQGITKERIDEVVELVGLGNRIHEKVQTYSLGMRQRLGVAQALLHRPKLLILDEPTNGLDPQGIRELRDYLRRLTQEEGTTVFVSSHLLSEMELMCDTVGIIRHGKLVDIRQLRTDGGERMFEETAFTVSDADAAAALLQDYQAIAREHRVLVRGDRDMIADINAALVEAGIRVYAIQPVTRSLEDQFLEMTGGGSLVE
ncbi:ABC transporter ATP-binding protein [Paenibacillus lautus]|uniref:ABC transporter ATP-binding protein n=1 Tax=Paenibacillus lautus TaxID=1401 RepID=A0A385TIC5_PAELA|nr:ABC transporter ATP-binding protein [Paenibacillus lautus]AYB42374.1 ABC transporter ATP-binding protein [Paenibacillus lautus]MBY0160926.1 ABC transporter ATP-binding protein [Cytobacillus firmus]VTR48094.1 ABC transporter-like protein [Actinobacillus pleuropneumoniae]